MPDFYWCPTCGAQRDGDQCMQCGGRCVATYDATDEIEFDDECEVRDE